MNICSVRYSQMLEVQRPVMKTNASRGKKSVVKHNTRGARRGEQLLMKQVATV